MKIVLDNASSSLTVDLFGGAITNFHLKSENNINPLSFAFTKEQMPENNKAGASYQGHFLCLGRWGLPSEGEIKAGIPNHGEIANILWSTRENNTSNIVYMEATGKLEGLHIERRIELDKNNPVYSVQEVVTNINPLGRLYNMVQHPALAAPFLDDTTIIDCNATVGLDQAFYKDAENNILLWPYGKDDQQNGLDLRSPQTPYNSVFSFIVNRDSTIGWITAYSPKYNLLFGYVWKRNDYPWIHLWQHWSQNKIQYRGIEFGTAGIHQPFKEILDTGTEFFGEKTCAYIDAGEPKQTSFLSFICEVVPGFGCVEDINVSGGTIIISGKDGSFMIKIDATLKMMYEL